MKKIVVREIRVTDYQDIYLLNQDFNPNLYLFSAEKVKERIECIKKEIQKISFLFVNKADQIIGYIHGSP